MKTIACSAINLFQGDIIRSLKPGSQSLYHFIRDIRRDSDRIIVECDTGEMTLGPDDFVYILSPEIATS
jgi:hypothetical protein